MQDLFGLDSFSMYQETLDNPLLACESYCSEQILKRWLAQESEFSTDFEFFQGLLNYPDNPVTNL